MKANGTSLDLCPKCHLTEPTQCPCVGLERATRMVEIIALDAAETIIKGSCPDFHRALTLVIDRLQMEAQMPHYQDVIRWRESPEFQVTFESMVGK